MKLKKVVSLALAGVLAVSMLAGCKNGTGSSSSTPTEEPAANDVVSQVVAALNDDKDLNGKVTITADAELQKALEILAANAGTTQGTYSATNLKKADSSFESTAALPAVNSNGSNNQSNGTSKEEKTAAYVALMLTSDSEPAYVAQKIIAAAESSWTYAGSNLKLGDELPMSDRGSINGSKEYTNADGKNVYYTFKYTLKVAVVPVANAGDTTIGSVAGSTTGYAYAFYLTRTPTEVLL